MELSAVNLTDVMESVRGAERPVRVLWQEGNTLGFVARGREHRSEFHVDPRDEVMVMLKGELRLHYRTPEGAEQVAIVREGEAIHCPAGVPHSPRFSPDAFMLVLEHSRGAQDDDRFQWYCERCGAQLYEAVRHVDDYRKDPVSQVYAEFYGSEAHRTCRKCGHVTPVPA
jgi:3-hydroxyanthranilate 3,4-dioxygenase